MGAVCVLYFLSFGLQIEDYAWIKTTQAVIFIGLDIPLGYYLSRIGEYKSLLLSITLGMIGVLGYLLFTSFIGFLISETFLALSLSTWPVALSAYSMRILEKYKTEGLVEKYFHCGDAISNLFVVVCGSLGGILYAFNKYIPYSCFLFFYILAALFILLVLKNIAIPIKYERQNKLHLFISNIKQMGFILSFATILFLAQFFMQPLFHYWQPLFEEKYAVSSKDMSIIFIVYSFTMSSLSWGYSRLTHFSILRSNLFILIIAIIGGVVYSRVSESNSFSISLMFLAISFGIFNVVQIAVGVLIQNKLRNENRMIITKYVSFYARMGMISSLIFLHWLFSNGWGTSSIYKLYGNLAMLVFCIYLGLMVIQKKSEEKYVAEFNG